jgi:hypothetical protein
VLAVIGTLAGLAAAPASAALITSFSAGVLNDENFANPQTSDYYTQAGGRPDVAYTKFTLNTSDSAAEFVRVDLPAGLTVNPQAIPRCSSATVNSCPANTQVGKTFVTVTNIPLIGKETVAGKVFNMTPEAGHPSDFAFEVTVGLLFTIRTDLVGGVRYYPSNGRPADFGNYFTISGISNLLGTQLEKSELIFWGAPAEHNGGGGTDNAFISNPSTCNGPETTYIFASTYAPTTSGSTSYTTPVGASGCDKEPFAPTIAVTPSTTQRDKPDGLAVDLHVPQDQTPSHIASSHLRNAAVTLPAGLTLNPPAANGLLACTNAQFRAQTNEALACPAASLVGTAEITTPVLGSALTGGLYVGQPLSAEPASGQEYRLFLDAENASAGVKVRLIGTVQADPATGRLTASFDEDPQVPFTDLKLTFKTGAGALFANPPSCGSATTGTALSPWSGEAAATPSSAFTVDQNGSGGACPGTLPFAPATTIAPSSTTAGASTSLNLEVARADGEQTLGALSTALPPGMLANLNGISLCGEPAAAQGSCPVASQIGKVTVGLGAGSAPLVLKGTVALTGPYEGQPFGLSIAVPAESVGPYDYGTIVVRAAVAVDTEHGRVTVSAPTLPAIVGGVPLRLRTIALTIERAGFLVNPTDCNASEFTGSLTSTAAAVHAFSSPVQMTGCGSLTFAPQLTVTPSTTERDTPSGLHVDLHLPSGSSDLASAVAQLPPGLTLNPAVAGGGLQACTDLELQLGTESAVSCPGASQVGTVEIATPLLPTPLTGALYVGQPLSSDPASGQEYRLFLDAENPEYGLSVRLAGRIAADPATGRLTVSFLETPPIPFTDLELNLASGPRAALANPLECGVAAFTSALTPVTGSVANPGASYAVDQDGAGGACPAPLPFAPAQSTGDAPSSAGSGAAYTLALSRPDGDQYLSAVRTQLPPGLLGRIAAVGQCPEALASAGACPASSLIGTAAVGVGAGPAPLQLPGSVYLTGPYEGSPFGLAVEVPAQSVGPFDYGTVLARARIDVDEHTARVTVTSDPLPTIVGGAPLRLQTLTITTSPSFTVNPTSCATSATQSLLSSTAGAAEEASTPFQPTGCSGLAFSPGFSAVTSARANRAEGAPLQVDLSYPGEGEANLSSVSATLPSQLPVRQNTLKLACPEVTFAASPAACPAASKVGSASAATPLLAAPLQGPAYLVSHAGASFPDLDLVLSGDGLRLALRGQTDIKSSVITTTFSGLPDVPLSHFTLSLPMGPYSALGAVGELCGESLTMSTTLIAQNGARLSRQTPVSVSGCAGSGGAGGGHGGLAHLRLSPSRFGAAPRGASTLAKPPRAKRSHGRRKPAPGTSVSYTNAAAGTTTFTVLVPARGERRGKACVARAKHPRRHARSCTRYRKLGSFTHRDGAGANRFWFTGRVHGRKLRRGRYVLEARASYPGGTRSGALKAAFAVKG